MKKKGLVIAATCLVITVLSFLLLQPAYATSITEDPVVFIIELIEAFISFLVWLVESFLAFLAQLFGV